MVLWLFIILKPISCNRSAWKMRSSKFHLEYLKIDSETVPVKLCLNDSWIFFLRDDFLL